MACLHTNSRSTVEHKQGATAEVRLQALLDAESPAKRTRRQQVSPSRMEAGIAAKRTEQMEVLDQNLKQVMNYADEKVSCLPRISAIRCSSIRILHNTTAMAHGVLVLSLACFS